MNKSLSLLLGFSAAVFAGVYLLPEALWLWVGLALLLPGAVCFLARRWAAGLAFVGLAAGLLWCGGHRAVFMKPAQELDGRRAQVTMAVCETPSGSTAEGYVLQPGRAPVRASVFFPRGLEDVRIGDTLTLTADLTAVTFLPEAECRSYASNGIFLLGKGTIQPTVEHPRHIPWWCVPRYWGEKLSASLQNAFPGDVSGFLMALVAGDRSQISAPLRSRLSRTGTSHLAAVSGMHVMYLVGLLTLLTGPEYRRRAAVCIPAVLFFVLMTGAAPSAARAGIIQIILLTAPLVGREANRNISLALALALLLIVNPCSAANIGLQLSFAACLGLEYCSPAVRRGLSRLAFSRRFSWAGRANAVLERCWDLISVTVGAMVFSLPLSMIYFGTLSLVSPLVNLLVVPVVSVLFAGVLLTGLVGLLLPGVAWGMGWVLAWIARLVLGIIGLGASVPYGAITVTDIYYPVFILAAYALGILGAKWKKQRRRPWVFLGCGGVVLLAAILLTRLTFHGGDLTVGVLDVGQGQAVVLSSAGQTALVDCGGSEKGNAGNVAADYLADRGEDTLDYLILTHYHSDHTNGLSQLFDRVKVNTLILPVMEDDKGTQTWLKKQADRRGMEVIWLTENTPVRLGEATLTLYAPLGDGGANEEGLSVLASVGDFHFLLTGDMNYEVEEKLVAQGLPECQVFVVGHHGSAHSTGSTLLDAIRPEQGIISVGANNDYGHPAPAALKRLERRGVEILRTDLVGTVTVTVTG